MSLSSGVSGPITTSVPIYVLYPGRDRYPPAGAAGKGVSFLCRFTGGRDARHHRRRPQHRTGGMGQATMHGSGHRERGAGRHRGVVDNQRHLTWRTSFATARPAAPAPSLPGPARGRVLAPPRRHPRAARTAAHPAVHLPSPGSPPRSPDDGEPGRAGNTPWLPPKTFTPTRLMGLVLPGTNAPFPSPVLRSRSICGIL
jgi:hypothetical protein